MPMLRKRVNNMEKYNLILKLKHILKHEDMNELREVIEKLQDEARKETYSTKPTDKKKLSTIEKALNKRSYRIYNQAVGLDKRGYTIITDSYFGVLLKDDILPFPYAFTDDATEEQKAMIKDKGLKIKAGTYPSFNNLVPTGEHETVKISCDELKYADKTTLKEGEKKVYKIMNDDGTVKVAFDLKYMMYVINIMQLTGDIELEIYGDIKPIVIRDKENIGIVLPIKIY